MKKIIVLLLAFILLLNLTGCARSTPAPATGSTGAQQSENQTVPQAGSNTTAPAQAAGSAEDVLEANSKDHEEAEDYAWDNAAVTTIALNGSLIQVDGEGVKTDGNQATITSAGTYSITGSLTDGQIIVDTQDKATVRLVLNGVDIHSTTGAPISVTNAEKTIIILADGTQNILSDAAQYVFADPSVDEPNAAIFSKSDLTIAGSGALTVSGNFNDGIASKDGLILASGSITVTAVDDGIRGKDYLLVKDGNITVTAQGDGLKSDNDEEADKGYISIAGGVLRITAAGDAIAAESDVVVTAGELTITAGGGSRAQVDESTSTKGIKGAASVTIDGGTFTIDSADDAIHSNSSIAVNGGSFTIATGDDGLHADTSLEINAGELNITESYEGIESALIIINAGNIQIASSDDGINVASGNDGSEMMGRGGMPGRDAFTGSTSNYLYINGGYIAVQANGDGIDVNGAIAMTDGILLVNGPTQQMNGALDYDAGFNMTGGLLVAAGSSGMAQAPDESSTQYSLLVNLTATQPAGTLVHIENNTGEEILTFAPSKPYQSLAFSSPELTSGETYKITLGGSSSDTVQDGLYQGGAYTPGTEYGSFTISSKVTMLGADGMGGPGGRGGRRP